MGGFPERRRALVDRAFETFGEAARWSRYPELVRVRIGKGDEDDRFGSIRIVRASTIIRVRGWEVDAREGDEVEITAGDHAGRYLIGRGAMRDRKGVWDCPATVQP